MRIPFSSKVFLTIIVAGIALLAASILLLVRLDYVIHHDLYNYGLQYSDEWAIQYWTYKNLTLIFLSVSMFANLFSLVYLFYTRPSTTPLAQLKGIGRLAGLEQKLSIIFLITGGLALAASISYNSTPTAFAGLGLVFW